jgi:hypothetical protein
MGAHKLSDLPPVPNSAVTASGFPRFGTYRGGIPEVDFSQLAGPYRAGLTARTLKQKRWQFAIVSTPEVTAAFAVVDLVYTTNAFLVVVDRISRRPIVDESFLGLPRLAGVNGHPGEGLDAWFQTAGAQLALRRPRGSDRYEVDVSVSRLRALRTGGITWRGYFLGGGGPPPLTVIAPVTEAQSVHMTQKCAGLLAFGELTVGRKRFKLDGGVAGLDYSNGFPPRHTTWRWAMAAGRLSDGTPVGLNLVEGFNEAADDVNENAFWLGEQLFPLSRARFTLNPADPLDSWRVDTVDGEVALRFRPLHVHREERDYKLIRARLLQPMGDFEGRVSIDGRQWELSNLAGVTEDQDVLW